MVLVPSYFEVDELVVPLSVAPATPGSPPYVLPHAKHHDDLEGLKYVASALIMRPANEVIASLSSRQDLQMPQELSASVMQEEYWDDEDRAKHPRTWERLTGTIPDLTDSYHLGGSFIRTSLVIPRSTFIKLMTRLYELNDAVREGRMEPRIDESMPVPPPPPPPPEPSAWTDDELRELEEAAADLDKLDPLRDAPAPDPYSTHSVENRRAFLFAMLEVSYLRTEQGDDNVPPRLRALELPTLIAYDEALTALRTYLSDPARAAIVDPVVEWAKRQVKISPSGSGTGFELATANGLPLTPFNANVSIDLFRLPTPLRPAELSSHTWIAHCEAAFVRMRLTGEAAQDPSTYDVFTRILGHQVRLRCRPEITPVLRMWRIELLR